MSVLIETTLGDIVIDLFVKERPKSCLNFLKLCKVKFYNFSLFHSIEQNYVAQTGMGKGNGSIFEHFYGEQARFFEMETIPKLRHLRLGTVSLVNNGADLNGSQFFITLADDLDYLDGKHVVFGQVAHGFDTLDKLNRVICDDQNHPYQDIRISHTVILNDPFDDPKQLQVPSRSPSPDLQLISSSRIAVDEKIMDTEGKTEEEIEKEIANKEAKARAHILEMIGDLHHADEKPPDNVLFVCKLNPVTTDQDLEIIFSRFGPIKCCEVIKDKQTMVSLQYAFIEFEKSEHCENAYFKMDNVLIDDRRIHVDFSQSVAKNYQWKHQVTESPVAKLQQNSTDINRRPDRDDFRIKREKTRNSSSSRKHTRNSSPSRKHTRRSAFETRSRKTHRRSRSRSPKRRSPNKRRRY